MDQPAGGKAGLRPGAAVKACILIAFVVCAVYGVHFTPARDLLTAEALGNLLNGAGLWAPVVFVFVFALGVCLFVPGTLLAGLGAIIFGAYWGFLFIWVGAMVGSSAAFFIGRTLGRDFAAFLIGDRLKKYDKAIETNGFTTVLYLRLIYFPFTPLSMGMGLTSVRFRDYLLGTGLGIIVGLLIFTFFIGTIKEVWASEDWSQLSSFKVILSVVLFILSFFIPKLIKAIRGEK
jgi:uncharacterized membrane protein YdjX (TVP38/TMEM64 family)